MGFTSLLGAGFYFRLIQSEPANSPFSTIACFLNHCPQTNQKAEDEWKTHTDTVHGFSFQYPGDWVDLSGSDTTFGEPRGIAISTEQLQNCTTAINYAKEKVFPYYTDIEITPIPNPRLDGFIIEDFHLDNITPGPEAYIINCPYVIRLGFNPTGIKDGKKVFDRILSSFKTWQPQW